MAIQVEIPYSKTLSVPKDRASVAAYLADTTNVTRDFSGLESFREIEPNVFEWKFEGISYGSYSFKVHFLTSYARKEDEVFEMHPKGDSPHALETCWKLTQLAPSQTQASFTAKLTLDLPVPKLLKSMAAPIAQKEITKLFERYLSNVEKHLAQ